VSLSLDFSRARSAARFFRDHRRAAAIIVGLALAIAAANALEPLVFKFVIDGLTRANGAGVLAKGIALFAGIAIAREALGALSNARASPSTTSSSTRRWGGCTVSRSASTARKEWERS
jgi:hypothetical protein